MQTNPTSDNVGTARAVSAIPLADRLAFTLKETASLLGVSYITANRLVKSGKLRSSSAIRHKLIPRTEIERFLAA